VIWLILNNIDICCDIDVICLILNNSDVVFRFFSRSGVMRFESVIIDL
jgi:hypothetical protein